MRVTLIRTVKVKITFFKFRFVYLLCLWSTLYLFHFWIFHFLIFHRCDPMPNLKEFCYGVRHEMVSHLFPFLTSISKLALRLFDLTSSKTRLSSHITSINRCLYEKFIPHGFRSPFNPLRFNLPAFHILSQRLVRFTLVV